MKTEEVFSRPEICAAVSEYAHEVMFLKDIDEDIILWCNEAAARMVFKTSKEVIGTHSSRYYPDADGYRVDDLAIWESGIPRTDFLESVGGTHILTTKIPLMIEGARCILILSLNCTEASDKLLANSSVGTVSSYDAWASARDGFRRALVDFRRAERTIAK